MVHGSYDKRRVSGRKPNNNVRLKGSGSISKKPKIASLKNQIRSTERFLGKKDLPPEIKESQERKLEELKKQQDLHNRLAVERKIFFRDKKIKFFERRKIERRIRRLEKHQRSSSGKAQETKITDEVPKLKEDLEYVKFFPKKEKYVPLYCGGDNEELVEKRNKLRMQIKANILAAAANGKELEETGSEDDGLVDLSDDDFFLSGTSSDEADADCELTDLSAREQASSASGKTTSGMSSDEKNQKHVSTTRSLMPPPRPMKPPTSRPKPRIKPSTSRANTINSQSVSYSNSQAGGSSTITSNSEPSTSRLKPRIKPSTSRANTINSQSVSYSNSQAGHSSTITSNSEPSKRRRKRRPKKK